MDTVYGRRAAGSGSSQHGNCVTQRPMSDANLTIQDKAEESSQLSRLGPCAVPKTRNEGNGTQGLSRDEQQKLDNKYIEKGKASDARRVTRQRS